MSLLLMLLKKFFLCRSRIAYVGGVKQICIVIRSTLVVAVVAIVFAIAVVVVTAVVATVTVIIVAVAVGTVVIDIENVPVTTVVSVATVVGSGIIFTTVTGKE
jgi:hypothetical protein